MRGKQGATRRFRPIAGSSWFGRGAPAADDEEARVEASPPGECAAVARAAPHVALAAMRAITHVVGKLTLSSQLPIEVASRSGGAASATLRASKRRSTAARRWCSLSPAVAVVGTRSDGALACRPEQRRDQLRRRLLLTQEMRAPRPCVWRIGVSLNRPGCVLRSRRLAPPAQRRTRSPPRLARRVRGHPVA